MNKDTSEAAAAAINKLFEGCEDDDLLVIVDDSREPQVAVTRGNFNGASGWAKGVVVISATSYSEAGINWHINQYDRTISRRFVDDGGRSPWDKGWIKFILVDLRDRRENWNAWHEAATTLGQLGYSVEPFYEGGEEDASTPSKT